MIPTGKKNEWLRYSGLQLRQEIFTPKDLAADSISAGDHPYSSTLTLSQVSVVNMPDWKIRIVSGLNVVFKLSAGARYIISDATLQGGIFNKTSPYVIPSDKVMQWIGNQDISLTFELLAHQLEFYTQMASPRFHSAAPHGWMAIVYKYWF